MKTLRLLTLLWLALAAPVSFGANLLVNGDFETLNPAVSVPGNASVAGTTRVTGWTATAGNGTGPGVYVSSQNSDGWIPNAQHGNFCIQLDSTNSATAWTVGSAVSQTIYLLGGQTYSLTFHINTEVGSGKGGTSVIDVSATGSFTYGPTQFSVTNPANVTVGAAVWAAYTVTFTPASSGNVTFKFQDDPLSGNSNVALDNVDLEVVPQVSGTVYLDANHNASLDPGEGSTGLAGLFVKLVPSGSPTGPAVAAAAVAANGTYLFANVAAGSYTLVLNQNATLSDVTPSLPAGWSLTEAAAPIAIKQVPVDNANFGLIQATSVSGLVFADTGAGGGTANDGARNGTEPAVSTGTLVLQNAAGTTTYDTAAVGADGTFTLYAPSTLANGTALRLVYTNPGNFLATGAVVGNTAGTYTAATRTLAFNYAAATAYTGIQLGEVPGIALSPNGSDSAMAGSTVTYPHTFVAGSAGTVTFSLTGVVNPASAGWTRTLYLDVNGTGVLAPNDTVITGGIAVTAGQTLNLLVKEFVPPGTKQGSVDSISLQATLAYANSSLTQTSKVTDVTTVNQNNALALTKTVDKSTAKPGDTLTYTLSFTNQGAAPISNLVVFDATPAYTTFLSAATGTLPAGLTVSANTNPGVGKAGAVQWNFAGSLAPGGVGSVQFQVKVDQ